MERLWLVQKNKDGTYGDWKEFKENKEGIIFTKGKICKYKTEEKMKILILEDLHRNNKGKKMQWRLKRTNLKVGDEVVLDCHDWKIIKVIKEKKRNENDFNREMLGISCDLGIDDYGCMVGYRVDMDGNYKIENIEYLPKKEVKKVRPYFECEVVKVKKEKDFWCGGMRIGNKQYKVFKRKKGVPYLKEFEKGNWVNGENLDKIMFPVPCSYRSHSGKKHYAQLIKNKDNGKYKYELLRISQDYGESIFLSSDSLKKLIRKWDIHILKGKIILFEEVK